MTSKIVIYGATGGIGRSLAELLHQQGKDLHLVGRDQLKLGPLAESLQASYTVGDVQETELFTRVNQDCGEYISGLVYAVGTIQLKSISRLTEADFLTDFRVNALGAALAIQAALPALKKQAEQAAILLFSSVAAKQGFSFHASIGMAKAAVEGLTLSLASELAPKIRVNALAPSLVNTPLAAKLLANPQTAEQIAQLHPLQRIGQPDEIAKLAAFLLSSDAAWITGQIIGIDGGRSSLRPKG
jgi:NAD(P)-dependent dehydrogenase (short-subunit alcohol dehydrogenase family)